MTQPPSDDAMRAARVVALDLKKNRLLIHWWDNEEELAGVLNNVAAIITKYLPVSEQGRDYQRGVEDAAALIQSSAWLAEVPVKDHPQYLSRILQSAADAIRSLATTPPPASDERCAECGHESLFSDEGTTPCKKPVRREESKDKSTAETHADDFEACGCKCEFPAPSVPASDERCACGHGFVAHFASDGACDKCECSAYRLPALLVPAGEKDDGWVTFGTIKTDIENETQTFERVSPEPAPSSGDADADDTVPCPCCLKPLIGTGGLCENCYKALTSERERTRTAIVGLVRKREAEWNKLSEEYWAEGDYSNAEIRMGWGNGASACANEIERTPLDEVMKGGE